MNKPLAIVAVLVACLAIGEAVKCYQCSTTITVEEGNSTTKVTDSSCGDPYTANANQSRDCADLITACVKSKTTTDGNSVVIRSCGLPGVEANCKSDSVKEICICSGENCNTAEFAKVSLVVLIATVGLSFTFLQ